MLPPPHAVDVGLLDQNAIDSAGGFSGLYDLDPLNAILKKEGMTQVKSP